MRRVFCLAAMLAAIAPSLVSAQSPRLVEGRYQPLDRRVPPGETSAWLAATRSLTPGYVQPVRLELPAGSTASVFSGTRGTETPLGNPAQTGLVVGNVYRFRVTNLPDAPGAELYPTIELVGHLHPPTELKHDFPVRVPLEIDEIRLALAGRLLTKVVYLEQPQLASTLAEGDEVEVNEVSPRVNVLHEADRRGRPVAILRIGGRVPTAETRTLDFVGTPPPVSASQPTKRAEPPKPDAPTAPSASLLNRFDERGRVARDPATTIRR